MLHSMKWRYTPNHVNSSHPWLHPHPLAVIEARAVGLRYPSRLFEMQIQWSSSERAASASCGLPLWHPCEVVLAWSWPHFSQPLRGPGRNVFREPCTVLALHRPTRRHLDGGVLHVSKSARSFVQNLHFFRRWRRQARPSDTALHRPLDGRELPPRTDSAHVAILSWVW